MIQVVAAVVERSDRRLLIGQRRKTDTSPLKWEFPGGKIDQGESAEACVKRELLEEMGVLIDIRAILPPSTHCYPDFSVTLYPIVCFIVSGEITLVEHAAISWLPPERLNSLDWAEADFPIIDAYLAWREQD